MLKISRDEAEQAGGALMQWWDGVGAARVYAHDSEAVLLERAMGHRSLLAMAMDGADDAATRIICGTVAKLHAPRQQAPARAHSACPLVSRARPGGRSPWRHTGPSATGLPKDCLPTPAIPSSCTATFTTATSSISNSTGGWQSTPKASSANAVLTTPTSSPTKTFRQQALPAACRGSFRIVATEAAA